MLSTTHALSSQVTFDHQRSGKHIHVLRSPEMMLKVCKRNSGAYGNALGNKLCQILHITYMLYHLCTCGETHAFLVIGNEKEV